MAKYEESHETPRMEAKHHPAGFLKKAVAMKKGGSGKSKSQMKGKCS